MDNILPALRTQVDLQHLLGDWFELARTTAVGPSTMTDTLVTFLMGHGVFIASTQTVIDGRASAGVTPIEICNSLNTRFRMGSPDAVAPCSILMLDTAAFRWMVLAGDGPDRWVRVLSRDRTQPQEWWMRIFDALETHFGVDPRTIEYTVHSDNPPRVALPPPPPGMTATPIGNDRYVVNMGERPL